MLDKANAMLNKFYNNPYVASVLLVFFLVYASMVAPTLPPYIAQLFGNPFFKVFFMMMILLVKQFDATLALIVSIGFLLSLQTFHRYESQAALKDLSQKTKEAQGSQDSYYPETPEEIQMAEDPENPETPETVSGLAEQTGTFSGPQGYDNVQGPHGFEGTVEGFPYDLL